MRTASWLSMVTNVARAYHRTRCGMPRLSSPRCWAEHDVLTRPGRPDCHARDPSSPESPRFLARAHVASILKPVGGMKWHTCVRDERGVALVFALITLLSLSGLVLAMLTM